MKKLILATLYLCRFYLAANAQITITAADMPAANDSPRISYSISNIDISKTGPNYKWNFDSLKSQRQTAAQYLPASKTPYSFYFSKDIGQKVADSIGGASFEFKNVYSFYKNSVSSFSTVGEGFSYSGFPLASTYKIPDNIYIFPLNYGDRDSSDFSVSFSLGGVAGYSQVGYRITTVDGYGSIETPFKKYDSCLRVHSVVYEIDSVTFNGQSFGTPLVQEEYKWLVHGDVIPVLEVDGTNTAGTFVPANIIYRDSFRTSPLAPVPDFIANDTVVTTADTVRFTNNTAGAGNSYSWALSPGTFNYVNSASNSANPDVIFTAPGKYTVSLTATSLLGNTTKTKVNYISVTQASGINTATAPDNFASIYPNPAKDKINIRFNQILTTNTNIEIHTIDGKLIQHQELPAGSRQATLNLSGTPSGTYIMIIISDGYKVTKQFSVE